MLFAMSDSAKELKKLLWQFARVEGTLRTIGSQPASFFNGHLPLYSLSLSKFLAQTIILEIPQMLSASLIERAAKTVWETLDSDSLMFSFML